MVLLPFEREMFAVSVSDHDVQISVGMRVEPPQNFCIAQIPGHTISLKHWFKLFPRDGSSDYTIIPKSYFIVCNRHEFHDLATLHTQVVA
jgi:hypothetical protein